MSSNGRCAIASSSSCSPASHRGGGGRALPRPADRRGARRHQRPGAGADQRRPRSARSRSSGSITSPVEPAMSGLPRVEEVRSVSKFGLSAVTVVFEDGTDIYFARQLVNERLRGRARRSPRATASPSWGPSPPAWARSTSSRCAASSVPPGEDTQCYSPMELRTILDWEIASAAAQRARRRRGQHLRRRAEDLRGGSSIPSGCAADGLASATLFDALERTTRNAGGAYIVRDGEQVVIRGEGLHHRPRRHRRHRRAHRARTARRSTSRDVGRRAARADGAPGRRHARRPRRGRASASS